MRVKSLEDVNQRFAEPETEFAQPGYLSSPDLWRAPDRPAAARRVSSEEER